VVESDGARREAGFWKMERYKHRSTRLDRGSKVRAGGLRNGSICLSLMNPRMASGKEQLLKVAGISFTELECPQVISSRTNEELESFADQIFRVSKEARDFLHSSSGDAA